MIYCNVTECVHRNELTEKVKMDSSFPNYYNGYCNINPVFELYQSEDYKYTHISREEAVCTSFSDSNTKDAPENQNQCDVKSCFHNNNNICSSQTKYVDWQIVNNKEKLPTCRTRMDRRFKDRFDWSRYPQRSQ